MDIEKYFEMLTCKNAVEGCAAMDRLCLESTKSSAVYAYMDRLFELLDNKSSYVRNRALNIIAVNAKWDKENKIDASVDSFLAHISDEKPITARQCIGAAVRLGETKKALCDKILCALRSADTKKYADSMRPLVEKDIEYAIKRLEEYV